MSALSYEGKENYIFISYAHKDSDKVLKILEKLVENGYRIWYDDGIAPGSEWPENIAQHLDGCAVFLAFISNNSIASSNCRREVTFALSKQKPFLGVVLEPTEMSLGMQMQLSAHQCILRHNYRWESDFMEKIFSCPDLECCKIPEPEPVLDEPEPEIPQAVTREEPPVKKPRLEPKPKPAPAPKPKKVKAHRPPRKLSLPMLIGIIVLAAALVLPPVVIIVVNNLPITIAEGEKVSPNEENLSLREKTITAESVQNINKLDKLTSLYLYDCVIESGALDGLNLPGLKVFSAKNSPASSFAFLANSPQIHTLDLTGSGATDGNLPAETLTNVRYLTLAQNPGITDVSKWNLENLRELDISGTGVTNISCLAEARELADLSIAGTQVKSIDALASLEELRTLNATNCAIKTVKEPFMSLSLRELYMGGNGLTDATGFQNFTVLKYVNLKENDLTDISWLAKSTASLQEVNLSHNNLDGEDLQFLKDATGLIYLNISGLPVGDLSMAAGSKELQTLVANDCGLTDISALSGHTALKYLYLYRNQLTSLNGLPVMASYAVLDLSGNKLESIADIPEGNYQVITLLDNPLSYTPDDFAGIEGSHLFLDYDESLDACSSTEDFMRIYLIGCPADRQLALQDLFGYGLVYVDKAEMLAKLEEQGIVYPDLS